MDRVGYDNEVRADTAAVPVLQEHFGKNVPARVRFTRSARMPLITGACYCLRIMFKKCKIVMVLPLVFLVSLSTISSRSQGICDLKTFRLETIKGKVVSEGPSGNEPIGSAKVELWTIGALGHQDVLIASTLTNEGGLFEIGDVKDGHYRLEVSKPNSGFIRNFAGVKLVKNSKVSGKRKMIQFRLGVESLRPCGGGEVYLVAGAQRDLSPPRFLPD